MTSRKTPAEKAAVRRAEVEQYYEGVELYIEADVMESVGYGDRASIFTSIVLRKCNICQSLVTTDVDDLEKHIEWHKDKVNK